MIEPATSFTSLNPKHYSRRFMVQVIEVCPDCTCQQIDQSDELCLEEKLGDCCICGTPTCSEHTSDAYCIVHGPESQTRNLRENDSCLVCDTCFDLPREVQ